MSIKIVDTTLRDGEQKAGIVLGINEKVQIACLLDKLDIYEIEAGTPAMGGSEKESIIKIMELRLKSKVAAWNRMNIKDIRHSIDCCPDIIHISAPASDIHIKTKLNKDRSWVIDNLMRCISFAKENGFQVTVGLEDASRADFTFLLELIKTACREGAKMVRYADTVGILHSQRIYDEVKKIKNRVAVNIGIHAHNDFGMAVSNSISAVKAGADFVDCTIGGLGERAGNCDYLQFIKSAKGCLGDYEDIDTAEILEKQMRILDIIGKKNSMQGSDCLF